MNASFPKIRMATLADIPELMDVGRELHAENGMMTLSEENILAVIKQAVNKDGSIMGIIGDVGHIEGVICLVIGRHWYTNDSHLEELFSFVRKKYRKSNNAKALIEYAKRTADKLELPLLIGIVSNSDTRRKVLLYERSLGEPAGAYFLYGAKTGSRYGKQQ